MKLLKYGLPLLVVAIIAIVLISPGKQKNSSVVQTNESESKATDIAFGQTIDIEIQGQNHVRPGTTDYTAHNSNPPT